MRTAPPAPQRRRPHPAQRARRIAGAVSVAGMVLLTGCMAVAGKTSTATTKTSGTNATPVTATSTTPATVDDSGWDDDSERGGYSFTAPAVAATPAPLPNTSTNAS